MSDIDDATHQEQRKKAGDFLKLADKLFKSGDFEEADRYVKMAMAADPKNPYVLAYSERIALTHSGRAPLSPSALHSGTVVPPASPAVRPPQKSAPKGASRPPAAIPVPPDTRVPGQAPLGTPMREIDAHGRALEEEMRRNAETETRRKQREEEIREAVEFAFAPKLEESNRRIRELQAALEKQEEKFRTYENQVRAEKEALEQEHRSVLARSIREEAERIQARNKQEAEAEAAARKAELAAAIEGEKQRFDELRHREEESAAVRRRVEEEKLRVLEETRLTMDAEHSARREEMDRRLAAEQKRLEEKRAKDEAEIAELRHAHEHQLRSVQEELRRNSDESLRAAETSLRGQLEGEFARKLDEARGQIATELRHELDEERHRVREVQQQESRDAGPPQDRAALSGGGGPHDIDPSGVDDVQYEEAVREAIEEGRRVAQLKKVSDFLNAARTLLKEHQFSDALMEVTKALRVDPDGKEALVLEQKIYAERDEDVRRQEKQARIAAHQHKMEALQKRINEHARMDGEERKRQAVREAKASVTVQRIREQVKNGQDNVALAELDKLFELDPGNAAGREIESRILSKRTTTSRADVVSMRRLTDETAHRRAEAGKELKKQADRDRLRADSLSIYRSMLHQIWANGIPSDDDVAMVKVVRLSLGISDEESRVLEHEAQADAYREAVRSAAKTGIVRLDAEQTLEPMRQVFGLAPEEGRHIEAGMRS